MDTRVEVDNPSTSTTIPEARPSSSYKRQSVHRIDRLASLSGQALLSSSLSSPSSSSFPVMGINNGHAAAPSLSNPASRRESLYASSPSIWDSEPVWM